MGTMTWTLKGLTFLLRKSAQRAFASRSVIDPVRTQKFYRNPWEQLRDTFNDDQCRNLVIPTFKQSLFYGRRMAIKDSMGEYSYFQLYYSAKRLSLHLSNLCGSGACSNVALLCANNFLMPLAQWTCWISGQVAMPLNFQQPFELLTSQVQDAKSTAMIATPEYEELATRIAKKLDMALLMIDHNCVPPPKFIENKLNKQLLNAAERIVVEGTLNNQFYTCSDALRLYTPGITGKSKAVVLTYKNLDALIKMVIEAYRITDNDSLLHVPSKHHSYGSIMTLLCPLSIGGKVIMHDRLNSEIVWVTLLGINAPAKERPSIFMADPAVYSELIAEFDEVCSGSQPMVDFIHYHCKKNLRIMTSSGTALPPNIFNRWYEITGHKLIENYGMTECGMALSNPYVEDNSRERTAGNVGLPLPGTTVRLIDAKTCSPLLTYEGRSNTGYWAKEENNTPTDFALEMGLSKYSKLLAPTVGELCIRGPHVFREYSEDPVMTENAFIEENYFRTGDMAVFENGVFKIIGRVKRRAENIDS